MSRPLARDDLFLMNESCLDERFESAAMDPRLRWHCEPARWSVVPAKRCLRVEPDGDSDFWQRTHYGIEADNGHLLYADVTGDFIMSTGSVCNPFGSTIRRGS
jgi:hypothetical protein